MRFLSQRLEAGGIYTLPLQLDRLLRVIMQAARLPLPQHPVPRPDHQHQGMVVLGHGLGQSVRVGEAPLWFDRASKLDELVLYELRFAVLEPLQAIEGLLFARVIR